MRKPYKPLSLWVYLAGSFIPAAVARFFTEGLKWWIIAGVSSLFIMSLLEFFFYYRRREEVTSTPVKTPPEHIVELIDKTTKPQFPEYREDDRPRPIPVADELPAEPGSLGYIYDGNEALPPVPNTGRKGHRYKGPRYFDKK